MYVLFKILIQKDFSPKQHDFKHEKCIFSLNFLLYQLPCHTLTNSAKNKIYEKYFHAKRTHALFVLNGYYE